MRILLLDNYDSFTYNLVQGIEEVCGIRPEVSRNDTIGLEAVEKYDIIILSPGPGVPADAGIMPALIKKYTGIKPILGVCLGHQAIAEAFGGTLVNLDTVFHGIATSINILEKEEVLFQNLQQEIEVGRYHSWVVDASTVPDCLQVTAVDAGGLIMALSHRQYLVKGVQFHPKSVLTPEGKQILKNFMEEAKSEIVRNVRQ